jgi:uncharacterized protein YbaP (TraB family)
LLYRISGKDLKAPSYIVGTYHLAPGTFADSIPGLKDALASCKQMYGELDMRDALKNPEKKAEMENMQFLPEGKTLTSLLSKEQLDRLNALMRETLGADLSNPAMAQIDKMTPMTLATTLTMFAYMKKMPRFNPMDLIDAHLQTMAEQQGLEIRGFETVEFQLKVLYGSPLEEQVNDLMCMVDNFKDGIEMAEFVTAAYFSQDLDMLLELETEDQEEGPCASDPEENERLVYDRNRDWVKHMPEIMGEAPTFFAVGAAHLVGDKGVLRLLEEKGYKVEGVK